MPDRFPCVAGTFYPAVATALVQDIENVRLPSEAAQSALLTLVPHAGYVYCAGVIGATLAQVQLPELLFILCPNHTGRGAPFAVWPDGLWHLPTGTVSVDAAAAQALCASPGGFTPDIRAHEGEHSIEVLLPFLQYHAPATRIVPICVGTHDFDALERAGKALGQLLLELNTQTRVAMLVSSDMNHFADQQSTVELDMLAIKALLTGDPAALYTTVVQHQISMCGAFAATLALHARAYFLAATQPRVPVPHGTLVHYTTSAEASGDTRRVVGYAGVWF